MADLLVEVLRSYVKAGKFTVHDFVIMPNHIHLLMTIPGALSLEGAMQLIKGNFSFRANKELGSKGKYGNGDFPMCSSPINRASNCIAATSITTP
jgi:putative transposase